MSEQEDKVDPMKAKLKTHTSQIEIHSKSIQKNIENIQDNKSRVTDMANRIEAMQKELNKMYETLNQAETQEINSTTKLEEGLNKVAEHQERIVDQMLQDQENLKKLAAVVMSNVKEGELDSESKQLLSDLANTEKEDRE